MFTRPSFAGRTFACWIFASWSFASWTFASWTFATWTFASWTFASLTVLLTSASLLASIACLSEAASWLLKSQSGLSQVINDTRSFDNICQPDICQPDICQPDIFQSDICQSNICQLDSYSFDICQFDIGLCCLSLICLWDIWLSVWGCFMAAKMPIWTSLNCSWYQICWWHLEALTKWKRVCLVWWYLNLTLDKFHQGESRNYFRR